MATAVITGASTGIGRDLAILCAKAGYDIAIVARNKAQLETLNREVGGKARIIPCDLSKCGAAAKVFDALAGVDIEVLINNAGVGMRGFFHELDTAGQLDMLMLNVVALTELTRLVLPGMVARKRGYVLNVSSTAAFQPGPLMAIYYASKAYVSSFSEALYNELHGSGVSVTTLCPGPTKTEFARRAEMENVAMVRNGPMMNSAEVAFAGFQGMMKRESVVIPGVMNCAGAFLTRFAPRQVAATIARKLQE